MKGTTNAIVLGSQVTLRASGTPNTSASSQLSELNAVYTTLTSEEKMRAFITSGDDTYKYTQTVISTGEFTQVITASNTIYISELALGSATRKEGTPGSVANTSSGIVAYSYKLYA